MKNLKEKIIHCLEKFPNTRNDDAQLTFKVIHEYYPDEIFYDEKKERWFISTFALKQIREDHVKRIRAKLNEEHLFLPTNPKVCKQRKIAEKYWREELGYN